MEPANSPASEPTPGPILSRSDVALIDRARRMIISSPDSIMAVMSRANITSILSQPHLAVERKAAGAVRLLANLEQLAGLEPSIVEGSEWPADITERVLVALHSAPDSHVAELGRRELGAVLGNSNLMEVHKVAAAAKVIADIYCLTNPESCDEEDADEVEVLD